MSMISFITVNKKVAEPIGILPKRVDCLNGSVRLITAK